MGSSTRAALVPEPLGILSFWYLPLSPGQLQQLSQETDVIGMTSSALTFSGTLSLGTVQSPTL